LYDIGNFAVGPSADVSVRHPVVLTEDWQNLVEFGNETQVRLHIATGSAIHAFMRMNYLWRLSLIHVAGHRHGLTALVQLCLSVMQEEDESSEEAPVRPAKKGRGSNTAKR
jgi:hypothetical protein